MAAAWQKQGPGNATILEATSPWRTLPAANIGVPTGRASRLFCLDFDGEEGLESLAALEGRLGRLPVTPTQQTGGGGLQVFFLAPVEPLRNTVSTLASKVDTRAEGGQCVVAPSLHRSGRRYEWIHKPSVTPVAELAQAWLEAIRSASPPARQEAVVSTAMGPTKAFTPRPRAVAVAALANLAQSEVCSWMKSHPDQVSRQAWIAAATNIAAAVKGHPDLEALGRELFHEMSRPYGGYTKWECDREWLSALAFGLPSGWAAMEGLPNQLVVQETTNWLHAVTKGGR